MAASTPRALLLGILLALARQHNGDVLYGDTHALAGAKADVGQRADPYHIMGATPSLFVGVPKSISIEAMDPHDGMLSHWRYAAHVAHECNALVQKVNAYHKVRSLG